MAPTVLFRPEHLRNLGLLNVDRIAHALETDLAGLMSEVEAERRR
jgi:hypothetical protein